MVLSVPEANVYSRFHELNGNLTPELAHIAYPTEGYDLLSSEEL